MQTRNEIAFSRRGRHRLAYAGNAGAGGKDHREYLPTEVEKPAEARLRLQQQIDSELMDAAERAAREHEAAEAARLAMEAELAARPFEVRLVEARCATVCHGPERYAETGHSWLGWLLVVLRMKYLNDAIIESGEGRVLARHLTDTQPASILRTILEYAMLPVLLALPWLGKQGWRRWKTRKEGVAP